MNIIIKITNMKNIAFLIAIFCSLFITAQINPTKDSTKYNDPQNMDVVYSAEASFPAGEAALYQLVYAGIEYSDESKESDLKDDLLISFDVGFDSTLTSFQIIHGVGFGIDEQVVTALMSLKFSPAIMNGIQIRQNVMLSIPVRAYPDM